MSSKCLVENCESRESNGDKLFTVPVSLRDKFIQICTSRNYAPTTKLSICSKHFTDADFKRNKENILKLKKNVLPTIFVDEEKLKIVLDGNTGENPPKKRSRKQSFNKINDDYMEFDTETEADDSENDVDSEIESESDVESELESDIDSEYEISDENGSIQDEEHSNKMLSSEITISIFEKNPEFYLGLQKENLILADIISTELNITKRDFYIILFKLRRGEPDQSIADRFDISHQRISQIISENIELLSANIKQFIIRPSNEQIKENLPESFWHRYHHVTDLVDCFEIPLEKPTNPLEQSLTWSSYYSDNTAKYHVGATPDGLITFISKGYGGRISDEKIVKESKYIEFLPPGAVVMGDRGYKDLDGYFKENGIPFIRPPSVSTGTKLPKDVAVKAKQIASLRINVERTIRKMRGFTLISKYSQIHSKYRKYLDFFVIIAAGLANMQKPLYKNINFDK